MYSLENGETKSLDPRLVQFKQARTLCHRCSASSSATVPSTVGANSRGGVSSGRSSQATPLIGHRADNACCGGSVGTVGSAVTCSGSAGANGVQVYTAVVVSRKGKNKKSKVQTLVSSLRLSK